jgi:3-methyladenine DNA glycosylase AlkD
MTNVEEVLEYLQARAKTDNLVGMARFGIVTTNRYGVSVPELRKLAKIIGRNHQLALKLWESGIAEARIVAGMIADPQKLTDTQMDNWVVDFNSWDVCDQVCMNLFDKSPLAWKKIRDWGGRQEEFVKRAAFALLACLAWHDKNAGDQLFINLLPLIVEQSSDNRNFVKKSVNWALRHIGKRNKCLNREALKTAHQIKKMDSKSARWIASDAIRELESTGVRKRLGFVD